MDRNSLLLEIIYIVLAIAIGGLCLHGIGQLIYWAVNYDLRLDSLTWFYTIVNISCRSVVSIILIRLAYKKHNGRIKA